MVNCRLFVIYPTMYYNQTGFDIFYKLNNIQNIGISRIFNMHIFNTYIYELSLWAYSYAKHLQ